MSEKLSPVEAALAKAGKITAENDCEPLQLALTCQSRLARKRKRTLDAEDRAVRAADKLADKLAVLDAADKLSAIDRQRLEAKAKAKTERKAKAKAQAEAAHTVS